VNRPHSELDFEKIVAGMRQFRNDYKGKIWIEVFLIGMVNAITGELLKNNKIQVVIKNQNKFYSLVKHELGRAVHQ